MRFHALVPVNADRDRESGAGAEVVFRIGNIVLLVLLAVALFKNLNGDVTPVTFTGFLSGLQDVPHIDTTWIRTFSTANLGWLRNIPLLGDLMIILINLFAVIMWVILGIMQVIVFIMWAFGYLFA